MRLSELDYDLPEELIAQEPLARRDEARLLVLDRKTKSVEHSRFYKLVRHLREGDLIVLNDTRVLPARLFAQKESGGRVELLMVRPASPAEGPAGAWIALIRTHRVLKENARLILGDGHALRITGYARPGRPVVVSEGGTSIEQILQIGGTLALPHYTSHRRGRRHRRLPDRVCVATRRDRGADRGAAFHRRRIQSAGRRGRPHREGDLAYRSRHFRAGARGRGRESHDGIRVVHDSAGDADRGRACAASRRRIITVGTSSTRALESWAITGDVEGFTGLFIHPGFRFKLADAMMTNFHMPRTTVLALVMAFAGRDQILAAYRDAIRHRYRFLSYGDAMLIL